MSEGSTADYSRGYLDGYRDMAEGIQYRYRENADRLRQPALGEQGEVLSPLEELEQALSAHDREFRMWLPWSEVKRLNDAIERARDRAEPLFFKLRPDWFLTNRNFPDNKTLMETLRGV